MQWYNPSDSRFRLCGLPFYEEGKPYKRFQHNPPEKLPEAVDGLSYSTAGVQVHIRARLKQLQVDVKLPGPPCMHHMPPTGQCGIDCYLSEDGGDWYFASIANPGVGKDSYTGGLVGKGEPHLFNIILNLPLYSGVESLKIGLDDDAEILEPLPLEPGRIVVYGSSIDQGGCASRPGMLYTNILSRWLNTEVVNLGFSGNALCEPEVAKAMREIKDVKMFILNCAGNCPDLPYMKQYIPGFIDLIREVYPTVPILLYTNEVYSSMLFNPAAIKEFKDRTNYQLEVCNARRAAGDNCIFAAKVKYGEDVDGHSTLFESTVDGTHPTDLGFMQMAKQCYGLIKTILCKY